MEEKKPIEEKKKKGLLSKIRDGMDDKEEQLLILSTFVRLGILIWSGGILTLAYVELPPALGIPKQDLDPTFIASVFTGVLATFGVQAGKKAGGGGVGITKTQMEEVLEKTNRNSQVIRIEHAPLVISTIDPKDVNTTDTEDTK